MELKEEEEKVAEGNGRKCTNAKTRVGFICTKLQSELSKKVPVNRVLKEMERASKPEQPGLSSSIRSEV